jgi:outer membrane protein assembly factor BamB
MPDGVVREWLVLGPVEVPEQHTAKDDVLPDEARLAPDEGQRTGPVTWKKITLDTAWLDFAALLGKRPDAVAYASTHVYSPTAGTLHMNLSSVGEVRVLVNGKAGQPFGTRVQLKLAKGWSRLLLRAAPGENDWFLVPVLYAFGPAEYHATGIAWRTPLPGVTPAFYGGGTGVAAPVIVGERIYVPSEPHDLVCLRKGDGKVLWLRRSSYFEAAGDEEKRRPAYQDAAAVVARIDAINAAFVAGRASLEQLQEKGDLEKDLLKKMKRVDAEKYAIEPIADVGFSGCTPASDGRAIYTWSASGVTACYDLDGRRRWIRVDRLPAVEHGFSSSPLLVDGKLVVFMRDLLAFDAASGRLAWRIPLVVHEGFNPAGFFHGSPVAATIGGTPVIVLGNGTIVRAGDGKVLYGDRETGNQAVASPLVQDGRLFQMPVGHPELVVQTLPEKLTDPLKLPTRRIALDLSDFPKHYLPWHLSSPVVHQGLAYLLNNAGVLTVVDVDAGTIVYQKLLDLDPLQAHNEGPARGVGASLALAGGRLYVLGNNGAALVLAPGRVYRQIAKNKIESAVMVGHWAERQERFVANPVFDGRRLYLRGEGHLYAIGP